MHPGNEIMCRREPGVVSPAQWRRRCKEAFPHFVDSLRRLQGLSLSQVLIGHLLAEATLKSGFNSLAYTSLESLMGSGVREAGCQMLDAEPNGGAFCGFEKNDLSPALVGLEARGIIRRDVRSVVEAGVSEVTVLVVVADPANWLDVVWRVNSSKSDKSAWLAEVERSRQRWSLVLPGFEQEPDLVDALAAPAANEEGRMQNAESNAPGRVALGGGDGLGRVGRLGEGNAPSSPCRAARRLRDGDAPGGRPCGTDRRGSRRDWTDGSNGADRTDGVGDAPEVAVSATERAGHAVARSGSRNGERPIKSEVVLGVGTLLKAVSKSSERALTLSLVKVKELLRDGTEGGFVSAGCWLLTVEVWEGGTELKPVGDGGKWRNRYRVPQLRGYVLRVFESLAESYPIRGRAKYPGGEAEGLFSRYGGRALELRLRDGLANGGGSK